jgi:hypothetical protein
VLSFGRVRVTVESVHVGRYRGQFMLRKVSHDRLLSQTGRHVRGSSVGGMGRTLTDAKAGVAAEGCTEGEDSAEEGESNGQRVGRRVRKE